MKHYSLYIAALLPLLLAACTADEAVTDVPAPAPDTTLVADEGGDGEIRVASTVPRGTVQGTTRASDISYPRVDGTCTADAMVLRVFRAEKKKNGTHDPSFSATDMKIEPNVVTLILAGASVATDIGNEFEVGVSPTVNASQRVARLHYTYKQKFDGTYLANAFAITGLAFDSHYRRHFTLSPAPVGTDMTQQSVTLVAGQNAEGKAQYTTPDLYFGPINLDDALTRDGKSYKNGQVLKDITSLVWSGDVDETTCKKTKTTTNHGIFYFDVTQGALNHETERQREGDLYAHAQVFRIVSQVNLRIKNVPSQVARLELVAAHVPTHIGLFGSHGGTVYKESSFDTFIYPVAAATAADCVPCTGLPSDTVVIASADLSNNYVNGSEVTLSSYLLPSEVGLQMKLRVRYKTAATPGRDYPVAPLASAVLQNGSQTLHVGNKDVTYALCDADYDVPAGDARLKSASPRELYVYDSTHGTFYSYANVRTNITADYERIVSRDDRSGVTLDIEPAFVSTHELTAY